MRCGCVVLVAASSCWPPAEKRSRLQRSGEPTSFTPHPQIQPSWHCLKRHYLRQFIWFCAAPREPQETLYHFFTYAEVLTKDLLTDFDMLNWWSAPLKPLMWLLCTHHNRFVLSKQTSPKTANKKGQSNTTANQWNLGFSGLIFTFSEQTPTHISYLTVALSRHLAVSAAPARRLCLRKSDGTA